ncbi:MAG: hypothetical protein RLZZ241_2103 [Bacteroidota bacterium]|jgi:hypothetical protein
MKKQLVIIILAYLISATAWSQLILDGQFRPRSEYRHGFGNLITETQDPGFATSTRARFNVNYTSENYQVYLSLQDVMVWGENRQILPFDQNNSFAIFEAWAKLNLANGWSTKLGRQVLSYDDQRILGGLDWAQQGRNHDAALISHKKGTFQFDAALAFNQDFNNPTGFQSVGNTYNTTGFFSYKTMQSLYLKKQWEQVGVSILALNTGFQNFDSTGNGDGISNLQTLGSHLTYKNGKLSVAANAFIQGGEQQGKLAVSGANLMGLDIYYKTSEKVNLGLGTERISGNKADTANKTEAFFPLYGTNHKFNGFMDYFYVGNHANSVGLIDTHVNANLDLGKQSSLMMSLLNFSGAQALPSGEKALGTELDLVFSKKFKGYDFNLGYSQLFEANGMYELKGVSKANAAGSQNWIWTMLTLKPKFLDTGEKE